MRPQFNLSVCLSLLFLLLLTNVQPLAAQPNPNDVAARTSMNGRLGPFYHGVASGDPLPDGVIIWTRITPDQSGPITVDWKMATDTGMTQIVKSGTASTHDSIDFTIKVDVNGLQPATWYYYQFSYQGRFSLTGRTRTAPAGDADSLRVAVVSCSNYPSGYFNAYGALTRRNDICAVIHLGDYMYEGGGFGSVRTHDPDSETVVLDAYRARYSQYRLDNDLRRVHQVYPFITVWDDHESANNTWKDGADAHDPNDEGPWEVREREATQAYHEWLPIRTPDPNDKAKIYRSIKLGNLAELFMLETRLIARDSQSLDDRNDPNRNMIGPDQLAWLSSGMDTTTSLWKIMGQQVFFAPLEIPLVGPLNGDAWDGYIAERQRIYDTIMTKNIENVVVLTGDIHTAWANDLPLDNYDPQTGANSAGVEFVCSSVTSDNSIVNLGQQLIQLANPHIKHINLDDHGYYILDLNKTRAQADFYIMDGVDNPNNYQETLEASWFVKAGNRHLEEASGGSVASANCIAALPSELPDNDPIAIDDPAAAGGLALFGVYPNPFDGKLGIKFHLEKPQPCRFRVLDMNGRLVWTGEEVMLNAGLQLETLDLRTLPAGLYVLELTAGTAKAMRRIVRQ